MKQQSAKNILLGVLIVGLVAMTVAFAVLSTNLSISSNASIPAQSWHVFLDDWTLDTANSSSNIVYSDASADSATDVVITEGTPTTAAQDKATTTITGYNFDFKKPGAHVQYTFNIKNTGTILAQNTAITKSTPTCYHMVNDEKTATECPALTYTVTCGGSPLATATTSSGTLMSDLQPTNGSVACTYFVGYDAVTSSSYNQEAITVEGLDIEWTWEQK